MPAAATHRPMKVTWLAGWLVNSRIAVPTITRRTPSMTVTAPATERVMTSLTLLAVAVSDRTAQRSHRDYCPASRMSRSAGYEGDL
jgi:hypothetical protein